jgi:hypothetical protein
MIDTHPARVPRFHSAIGLAGGRRGPLPPRRLGRTFTLSIVLHVAAAVLILALSLLRVGAVNPPPILVTFSPRPPAAPRLVPLREERPAPEPPPVRTTTPPRPAVVPPPRPVVRPAPRPEPVRVEPAALPIRIADAAPRLRIRDVAPPAPEKSPALEPVASRAPITAGTGEEPELAFLVPGRDRPRGRGGGIAGRGNGLPRLAGVDPSTGGGGSRGGGAGGGPGTVPVLGAEGAFTPTGLAARLGRKYGATLMEAGRLGRRTSDGARYALLLPMLTEAYRAIVSRGVRGGGAGGPVRSVQVDDEAVAIRYRDGTLHVIVPTGDGLVALYVSTDAHVAAARSKVDEAERALGALQRSTGGGPQG